MRVHDDMPDASSRFPLNTCHCQDTDCGIEMPFLILQSLRVHDTELLFHYKFTFVPQIAKFSFYIPA